jgi:Prion-inhibition and propagation
VYDAQVELEPVAFSLHDEMRSLFLRRQGRTGLQRKIKWALYEERHFRKLMDDITHLMDKLVTLFPSIHSSQQHLCEAEVKELGTDEKALASVHHQYLLPKLRITWKKMKSVT